jgi:hypothetical protein
MEKETKKYAIEIPLAGEAYTIYLDLTPQQAALWKTEYVAQESRGPLLDFLDKFLDAVGPKCKEYIVDPRFPFDFYVLWLTSKLSEQGTIKTSSEVKKLIKKKYDRCCGEFCRINFEKECLAGAMFFMFSAKSSDLLTDLLLEREKNLRETYLQMWQYTHYFKDIEPHEDRPCFIDNPLDVSKRATKDD